VVVALIHEAILPVDADGKSVLSEAAINQTLISTFCDKFRCRILSLIVSDSSAHFTTGFMFKLYNKLEEKPIRNALIPHQIQSNLERVSALVI
jgi:hypothetical protein